jgi:hypothetical protein
MVVGADELGAADDELGAIELDETIALDEETTAALDEDTVVADDELGAVDELELTIVLDELELDKGATIKVTTVSGDRLPSPSV